MQAERHGGTAPPQSSSPDRRSLWTRLDEQDQPPRLTVAGEIDLATADDFHRALGEATSSHPRLVVDLTRVEFLASTGIGTLYVYRHHLAAVVVIADSIAARALRVCGFPGVVTVPADR